MNLRGGVFVVHLQIEKEIREFPLKKELYIGHIPIWITNIFLMVKVYG